MEDAELAGLLDTSGALPPAVEDALPDGRDDYEISIELARFVARLVIARTPGSVLEFGSGRSSLAIARALGASGGGRLTSVEDAPQFGREAWTLAESTPGVDARRVVSRVRLTLTACGPLNGYVDAPAALAERAPYGLVLVDGPVGPLGRDWTLLAAIRHLQAGALVVVDDAARPAERKAVQRWLRRWPGLSMALDRPGTARGLVVLRFDGDRRATFRARTLLGTSYDRLRQKAGEWRAARGGRAAQADAERRVTR